MQLSVTYSTESSCLGLERVKCQKLATIVQVNFTKRPMVLMDFTCLLHKKHLTQLPQQTSGQNLRYEAEATQLLHNKS